MGVLQLVGVLALCATVIEAGSSDCLDAKDDCPREYIKFWLQNRNTFKNPVEVTEKNIRKIKRQLLGLLKVIIHGYNGFQESELKTLLVPEYLKQSSRNILLVDWVKMAQKSSYGSAIGNIPVAGKCTANLLKKLFSGDEVGRINNIQIIGFGLGAHVAGVVGHHLEGLGRITGLDPTWLEPTENTSDGEDRLDPTDAYFVEVFHSNSGWMGSPEPLGHFDFYLNNGRSQPGCDSHNCSHHRSVEVFAETINSPKTFYAKPCELRVLSFLKGFSKEICPYDKSNNYKIRPGRGNVLGIPRGTFKIETNAEPPFGKG